MSTQTAFDKFFTTAGSSSLTDDWATPKSFFEALTTEFNLVLDVAAAEKNHKCADWYGLDHPDESRRDGLAQDWAAEAQRLGGAVFMNPPYGKTIGLWTAKAREAADAGATVVCLVPARTDTRWFHNSCLGSELRFVRGRLKFNDGPKGAPFPSLLVVMRPNDKR